MSDSPRPDGSRAIDVVSDAGRNEKIEQLLLAGLDHYFAASYEQAINVWTRALFLDRAHPRARAYIDRARSALAERQRESEELLQGGVAALNRGENQEARRLLEAAIHRGAPADEAHPLLDRLNRSLEPGLQGPARGPDRRIAAALPAPLDVHAAGPDERRSSRALLWTMAASLILALAVAVYSLVVRDGRDWPALLLRQDAPATAIELPFGRDSSPPLPRRGEVALGRARSLTADGKWREALALLDTVRPTDPEKPEADRMRGEIQQRLMGLATPPRSSTGLERQSGRKP
jgi:hypothetical protein